MSSSAVEILKQQMRDKFPQAHGLRADPMPLAPAGKPFEIGTFPVGAISEVIPAGPVAGILLMVAGLLGDPEEASPHPELILIDGADSFDPGSFTGEACSKLLWVRCITAIQMVKAADLLINDGNVPFVMLDATGINRGELANIPATAWRRLKLAAERAGSRVIILSPFPLVPCVSLRLTLSANLSLHDFDSPRESLLGRLQSTGQELRRAT